MRKYPVEKKIYDSLSKRQKHYLYHLAAKVGMRRWFIRMDLNATCNLRCRMCYMSRVQDAPDREEMSLELLTRIAEEIYPKTRYLYLSCGYEPLLAKHFADALEFSKIHGIPYVSFNTNGVLLDRKWVEKIIDCGTSEILFSIDGASEETFKKIRGISLKKTISKIEMINAVKKERGVNHPIIRFNFTMMRSNIEDVPAYIDMAHGVGVEIIQLRHVMDFGNLPDYNYSEEGLKFHRELTNRILDEARSKSKKIGLFLDAPENFDLLKSSVNDDPAREYTTSECFFPWFQAVIDSNGQVQTCTHWKEKPQGNLSQSAFCEIYKTSYKALQKRLLADDLPFSCRTCPSCGGDKRPDA